MTKFGSFEDSIAIMEHEIQLEEIKMNLFEKNALRLSLFQDGPRTIAALIDKTGGIKELMEFFQWMYDNPGRHGMVPYLLQDIEDFDTVFEDQPVVWDGTFCFDDEGELWYEGYAGASGLGGPAKRVVKVTDQIMTG